MHLKKRLANRWQDLENGVESGKTIAARLKSCASLTKLSNGCVSVLSCVYAVFPANVAAQ